MGYRAARQVRGRPVAGRNPRPAPGLASGFTLIELLVVVAIIVVLIAILLPSLRQAKDQGYRARCAANQRGILQGCILYASEWNSRFPFSNWDGNNYFYWDAAHTVKAAGWLYTARFTTSTTSDPVNLDNLTTGAIWPYTRNAKLYRCPADYPPYQYNVQRFDSYGFNGALNGYGNTMAMPPYDTLATYRFRPDAIISWEVDDDRPGGGFWNDGANYPNEGLTRRHGAGATVRRIDGGGEYIKRADFDREQLNRPGRLYCNPLSADGR